VVLGVLGEVLHVAEVEQLHAFAPVLVSSVPIFCAFSNPLMVWQPKQPYLAISSLPSAASFCCSPLPYFGAG